MAIAELLEILYFSFNLTTRKGYGKSIIVTIRIAKQKLYEFNKNSLGFGPICLEFPGIFFPEKGWTDFLFLIFPEWVAEVCPLLYGELATANLQFFDSTHSVRLTVKNFPETLVELGNKGHFSPFRRDESLELFQCSLISFSANLLQVNKTFLHYANESKIDLGYLPAVAVASSRLESALLIAKLRTS